MSAMKEHAGPARAHAVEAVDLTKRFGDFVAVDGVSFAVERGSIFGFLGPNGAGKTTTIRMLLGLLRPTSGRATVLGLDIVRQTAQVKRRIGYMSQRFSLYDDLTVEENLNFYGRTYGVQGRRLQARKAFVLHMAGLEGRERELTRNLAGGWKQRLALGAAIVHEPEMLFLDEPTAGVDPLSRRAFWGLLYELAEGGTTIMVTTHYMDEAEHCQGLAFIQQGRIVAHGSPAGIKETEMRGEVLEIDCDRPDRAIPALRGMGLFEEVALYGALIHVVAAGVGAHKADIETVLHEAGVKVHSLDLIPPSLEDVFISTVRRPQET
ncbi:MAG: ABC transporter ATP-binding protein [Anaerolineae bacterium]|jgi:ABC-2 type transport system ATP-binding protein|nr:ABC transporter ATP-binding protein [Anaerolineae bacterium]